MSTSLNPHIVTTRKPHVCFGCGRQFEKGSNMERSGVGDGGTVFTSYLCGTCITISQSKRPWDEFGFSDLREEALEMEQKMREAEK